MKVTIVEPSGFRTDFAGASTQILEGNPAYADTVGKTAAMQRDYNGKQPGNPKLAAKAIIAISKEVKPPLRLVLGSDAYARAERADEAKLVELRSSSMMSGENANSVSGSSGTGADAQGSTATSNSH